MNFLDVLFQAGVDLYTPLTDYGDFLLRSLQLQAVIFLIGFGLRYTFTVINSMLRGSFF